MGAAMFAHLDTLFSDLGARGLSVFHHGQHPALLDRPVTRSSAGSTRSPRGNSLRRVKRSTPWATTRSWFRQAAHGAWLGVPCPFFETSPNLEWSTKMATVSLWFPSKTTSQGGSLKAQLLILVWICVRLRVGLPHGMPVARRD